MEQRVFFLLNQAHHRFFSDMERFALEQFEIPLAQLMGLFALQADKPVLMKQFGERMGLKNAAVTGLVNRMLRSGLIHREASQEDGRASLILLSPRGQQIRDRAKPVIASLNDLLSSEFSEQEFDVVLRFLHFLYGRKYRSALDTLARRINPEEGNDEPVPDNV